MCCSPTLRWLIVLTLPPRYRCPLYRLPASRLLLPRSGLERSDFVRWARLRPPTMSAFAPLLTALQTSRGRPDPRRPDWRSAEAQSAKEKQRAQLLPETGKSPWLPFTPAWRSPATLGDIACARIEICRAESSGSDASRSATKNILLVIFGKSVFYCGHPASMRGACASSRTRGGMRWTQKCWRRAASMRTAKSCGRGAPMQPPSWRRC
jgi:hypothetical protein